MGGMGPVLNIKLYPMFNHGCGCSRGLGRWTKGV